MAEITRSARWCFTVNNPGGWRPVDQLVNIRGRDEPAYMVWQLERGHEGGTEHIQGYVRFYAKRALHVVKNVFFKNGTIHLEPARGTEAENYEYCTKQDTRVIGEQPHTVGFYDASAGKQGARGDLDAIADEIKQGHELSQIADAHPGDYIRYHGGIEALFYLTRSPPRTPRPMTTWWLWGATGVGKTHRARTQFPDIFEITPGRDPFSGYRMESTVLFDEFDESKWTIQSMNKYLDKWPCKLDCRYRDNYAAWTLVVICANVPPSSCYPSALHTLRQAFFRRISHEVEILSQDQEVLITRDEEVLVPATPLSQL